VRLLLDFVSKVAANIEASSEDLDVGDDPDLLRKRLRPQAGGVRLRAPRFGGTAFGWR
jgi:hypothetical protein